jgi:alpha-beta hydrolase superfamily lysophospholipase
MTALRIAVAASLLALGACAQPVTVPMGPATVAPHLQDDHVTMADGAELPLRRWLPDGAPRAVIVGVHGFNDYSNAFAIPAALWARAGIATYAYDQRGFGAAPHVGRWPGVATMVQDLETTVRLVAARHPGLPMAVAGESMGGAVVLTAAAEHRLDNADGLVLVAPAVRGRETIGAFGRGALWFFTHTIPWTAGRSEVPTILPSDNIPMLRAFAADPLVIKNTRVDAVWGLMDLMDAALAAAPQVDRPVLALVGGRDDLVPGSASRLLLGRMPPAGPEKRRVALYANGHHMLLRDLKGDVVAQDVASWLLSRRTAPTAALPSGADAPAGTDKDRAQAAQ